VNEITEADFVKLINDAAGQFGLKYDSDAKAFVLLKPYTGWLPSLQLDLDFKVKEGRVIADRTIQKKVTKGRPNPLKDLAETVVEDFFQKKSVEWCKVKPTLGLMLNRLVSERVDNLHRFMTWSAKYILPHLFMLIQADTVKSEEDIRKMFKEIEELTGEKNIGQ
jgi:hypothetical protein